MKRVLENTKKDETVNGRKERFIKKKVIEKLYAAQEYVSSTTSSYSLKSF